VSENWDWTRACLHILFCSKKGLDCAVCERIQEEINEHPELLEPSAHEVGEEGEQR
jgi:hypothetical protein